MQVPRILGRHYPAIFVLACATLSYQILITRFFSVMLYYHFAFAAISLAMLGLTRGAMEVYNKPARYAPERVAVEFARHASWFAITGVGAMIAFLCVPLVIPSGLRGGGAGGRDGRLCQAIHRKRRLHHAFADPPAVWRRMALRGRSCRRSARMPRGHLRVARRRSGERHVGDRSPGRWLQAGWSCEAAATSAACA